MNKSISLCSIGLFLAMGLNAQQSKTYSETFKVKDNAVLEINTSHADIEFDTWNKNQVAIEATITVEGATLEEIGDFIDDQAVKIQGNSEHIEVTTRQGFHYRFPGDEMDFDFDFDFEPFFNDIEIPDLPELAVIPEMPPLPPMPPMPRIPFDYERYQEEGEEYLDNWSNDFHDGMDDKYRAKMEEWAKKAEEKARAWEEKHADKLEELERRAEQRAKEWESRNADRLESQRKRIEERAKVMEQRVEAMEARRAEHEKRRGENEGRRTKIKQSREVVVDSDGEKTTTYHYSKNGKSKKFKIKKSIKIKMPKSVKLKLNVRHGEVKLAHAAMEVQADLNYASLLASTIDGHGTEITASYTPMVINQWNMGSLITHYSENVKLKEVGQLDLHSVSSDIIIESLLNSANANNQLGSLTINQIAPNFKDIHIMVRNGELDCKLPPGDVQYHFIEKNSSLKFPESLNLTRDKHGNQVYYTSNTGNLENGKSFKVDSSFSTVTLKH